MSDNCKTGFLWQGTPSGTETKVAGINAYKTGNNSSVAILLIHDVFGWTLPNLRLLSDHFAAEAHATVYLGDFYDGEIVSPSMMTDPKEREKFDLPAFLQRHSKDVRRPEIFAVAKELRSQYKKLGVMGYCWGAWGSFDLAEKGKAVVDAVSVAHPSGLTKESISALGVPTQILAPENDPVLTPELKEFCNQTIPTLGIPYDYQYFPGVNHGFAVRGDDKDPKQKAAFERAKNAAVHWFLEFLHESK